MKLIELTKMLRSKNAGPLWLTMDLSFESEELLEKVLDTGVLTEKTSISLAQTGLIPCLDAARGKPPIPSNKLPIVNSYCSLLDMHLLYHNTAIC